MKNLNAFNAVYGIDAKKIKKEKSYEVYRMENATGEGEITRYYVFEGIELLFNDMHMTDECNQNKYPKENVMEINHCLEGRFECEFVSGECIYLGEGDLAINMLSKRTNKSFFPMSHYYGISIVIDIPIATEFLGKIADSIGEKPINLALIQKKLCKNNKCFVIRTQESISHIFSELYKAPNEFREPYQKLKIMELLLFLSATDLTKGGNEKKYFQKSKVEQIKKMKTYMIENLEKHETLKELSNKFQLPITSMKLCFKEIYGDSIYAYLRSYRLQIAGTLLRTTEESITQISEKVGYDNSSKFTEAFKKETKMTPTEYRRYRNK